MTCAWFILFILCVWVCVSRQGSASRDAYSDWPHCPERHPGTSSVWNGGKMGGKRKKSICQWFSVFITQISFQRAIIYRKLCLTDLQRPLSSLLCGPDSGWQADKDVGWMCWAGRRGPINLTPFNIFPYLVDITLLFLNLASPPLSDMQVGTSLMLSAFPAVNVNILDCEASCGFLEVDYYLLAVSS